MDQATFRGTRAELKALLRRLPSVLSGRTPDPTGQVEPLLLDLGLQALTITRETFLVKSQGGTDDAGIKWDELDPRYLAYGRRHAALDSARQSAKAEGRRGRPLLTEGLDKAWRGIFVGVWQRLRKQGIKDRQAKGNAAALAWILVKQRGGRTIFAEYSKAPHLIGQVSGRLLESLSPNSGSPDQILQVEPGRVTAGSKVEYAGPFHAKRPLWPEHWPETWTRRLADTLSDGLKLILKKLTGS